MSAQNWLWTAQFDHSSVDRSLKLATDNDQNSIFCGTFKGDFQTWGDDTMFDISSQNYYIAKADAEGRPLWAIQPITKLQPFGLVGTFYDMNVDENGNTYLAGTFVDSIRIGDKQAFSIHADSMDNSQMFYAKISPEGYCEYLYNAESTQYSWCTSISPSINQTTIIAGTYRDTIVLTGQEFTSGDNFATAYVASLNENGVVTWLKRLPSISVMTTDSKGIIHIAGSFSDEIDLDGNVIKSPFRRNFYYAQLNTDGSIIKENLQYGSVGTNENSDRITLTDMEVNSLDEPILTGYFKGGYLDLENVPVASIGDKTQFVLSMDANGNFKWSHEAGHIDGSWVIDPTIDINDEDDVYFLSSYEDASTLAGVDYLSKGRTDIGLIIFDKVGSVKHTQSFGDTSFDFGYGITCHDGATATILGNFNNYMDLGQGVKLYSQNSTDVFLVRGDFGPLTSTQNQFQKDGLQLFPNPTDAYIQIDAKEKVDIYSVFGVDGVLRLKREVNQSKFRIDFSQWPDGEYILQWTSEKGTFSDLVIKR